MTDAKSILSHLRTVDAERRRRTASRGLAERVRALKTYQQRRFAQTYADLLQAPRYAPAARFFLEELYGPRDYSERDAQFARVVPALVKLFPQEIVATVDTLAELHALSEVLDTIAGSHLDSEHLDAAAYARAWRATGRPRERERQVALTVAVGVALDRLTRNPVLRHTLRMMRGPAKAAGLAELQRFLETGFDTFRAMRGAVDFLETIARRERAFSQALFESTPDRTGRAGDIASGQLP